MRAVGGWAWLDVSDPVVLRFLGDYYIKSGNDMVMMGLASCTEDVVKNLTSSSAVQSTSTNEEHLTDDALASDAP